MEIKKFILNEITKSNFNIGDIEKFIEDCNMYKILKYKNITFHILYKNNLDIELYNKVIKRCNKITSKQFDIYIILYPLKRFLPKKNDIIKYININGGYTNIYKNIIFIIREEELPKVILHEILHHNKNINNEYWNNLNTNKLKKKFNISEKTVLLPNEAVVELFATLYHLKFIADDYKLDYNKLLEEELKYSLYKSYILKNLLKEKWYEKTNAYCYIIFKTIFLYNLKEFLKIKFPYNPDIITDFLIKYSELPIIKKNPNKEISNKSLRIMVHSDK